MSGGWDKPRAAAAVVRSYLGLKYYLFGLRVRLRAAVTVGG